VPEDSRLWSAIGFLGLPRVLRRQHRTAEPPGQSAAACRILPPMSDLHPLDTAPEISDLQFELWRQMSSEKKIRLFGELCDSVRHLARMGIRQRYPDATAEEVRLRLASTWLDRETMIRCYGWDPLEH
jgi:hypothetical protein